MEPADHRHIPAAPRFWLGMAQMAGAAFALALLIFSGISAATITAVAVTTILSLTSFAIRHHKPPMDL